MANKIRSALTPQMRDYDRLGQIWKPYLMFFHPPNFISNSVSTDEFGLRFSISTERQKVPYSLFNPPKNNLKNTLLIGNSTAFGVGSTSDLATISSLLGNRTNHNVFNLGGRAFSGFQEIVLFQSLLSKLEKVENIIVLSGLNDIFLMDYVSTYDSILGPFFYQSQFTESMNKLISPKRKLLKAMVSPFISREIDWNLGTIQEIVFSLFGWSESSITGKNETRNGTQMLSQYKNILSRNLKCWKTISEGLKVKFTFALQPTSIWSQHVLTKEEKDLFHELEADPNQTLYKIEESLSFEKYLEYKDIIQGECERFQLDFINLNDTFDSKEYDGRWIFVDRAHLTDFGNEIAATALYEHIKSF